LDRHTTGISEVRPGRLVVRLDRRLVLGKCQLEPGVGVEVTVRNVMHHLLHRPSAGAIRSLQLIARQPGRGGSQRTRCFSDRRDEDDVIALLDRSLPIESSYGIAEIRRFDCGGHESYGWS